MVVSISNQLKTVSGLISKIASKRTITFLGTGPATPITDEKGKNNRDSTYTMITYGADKYLIDIPPSFDTKNKFDYLLLTHFHKDSIAGFKHVEKRKFTVGLPGTLFDEFNKGDHKWTKKKLPIDKSTRLGGLKVLPFHVEHDDTKDFPTYGYQINIDGTLITYASDMNRIPKPSEKYFDNIDILITDGAGWDKNLVAHFGILPFLKMIKEKKWNIKKVYFTQISKHVPDFSEAQKIIKENDDRSYLTYDGMKIDF